MYHKSNVTTKKALLLFVIVALLHSFTACTIVSQVLPMPEFPLSKTDITDALQESGLLWTVSEMSTPYAQPNTFTLYKGTSQIGFLNSSLIEGERGLFIAFLAYFGESPFMDVYNPPEEDWKSLIVFLTLLYGGFESAYQVFHYFNNEINYVTRHVIEPPRGWIPGLNDHLHRFEEGAMWEKEVNGVYFHIRIARPIGSLNEYFTAVRVFRDWDVFGPIEAETEAQTEVEAEIDWRELLLRYPPPEPPEFWLDEYSITDAIQKSGLPWSVSADYAPLLGRTYGTYALYNYTTRLGYIRNTKINGERSLHGVFLHYQGDRAVSFVDFHTQSREDWDGFIVLFTHLFDDFESAHQVLDYFNNEIDYIDRRIPEPPSTFIEDFVIWEREINGVQVEITIARHYGRAEEHMRGIFMFTDWDIFGPTW